MLWVAAVAEHVSLAADKFETAIAAARAVAGAAASLAAVGIGGFVSERWD